MSSGYWSAIENLILYEERHGEKYLLSIEDEHGTPVGKLDPEKAYLLAQRLLVWAESQGYIIPEGEREV